MSIASQFQAKQQLLQSEFITSYGNFDLRPEEAQKWLADNGYNTQGKGGYLGVEALTGFTGGDGTYGARDRYSRPELIGIYYDSTLPPYIEEDLSDEQLAGKIKKYEAKKAKYLAEGEYARSVTFEQYLAKYIAGLEAKGGSLESYGITEDNVRSYYERDKAKVSYDHVEVPI